MACLGLHIALTDEELARIVDAQPVERPEIISEEFEEAKFGTSDVCETDKSWAYIHAGLNNTDPDGPLVLGKVERPGFFARLFGQKRDDQLDDSRFAIIGCERLFEDDSYYIGLIRSERVGSVSRALSAISADELGSRVKSAHYRYAGMGDADGSADYAMGWYPSLVEFFGAAAEANKHVIFTVDQ